MNPAAIQVSKRKALAQHLHESVDTLEKKVKSFLNNIRVFLFLFFSSSGVCIHPLGWPHQTPV
jgi:hypothetical protein